MKKDGKKKEQAGQVEKKKPTRKLYMDENAF